MSALDQVVQLLPLAAKKALAAKASNVLLVPATVPATVKHGALVHKDAGPARGSPLPARVVAVLGPGATFQGLAATLLPIYAGATGAKPLTADELANGLVVYNRDLLPAGTWGNHQVGLCLPLPIEIDAATGAWTLNADEVRGWAGSFLPAWRPRLSVPPTRLGVPELQHQPRVVRQRAARLVRRASRPLPPLRHVDLLALSGGRGLDRAARRWLRAEVRVLVGLPGRRLVLRRPRCALCDRSRAPDHPEPDRPAGNRGAPRRADDARSVRGVDRGRAAAFFLFAALA